ncbi:RAMP superfamily CRISPR-associated protein [Cronbergia sp. UHCC 0137]|uniref:RAMP superfamily CRISPR-associated protein n=1 Tax=Cronbergia sp. UHCC 0137 TaxID=3110239 RepID=UPI002B1FD35E|nr:RAMP superfamily CRISPR-associated protein [Cronbergia sp. UHCC 0137]MEA5619868.1 RAMP superfamily CRISPR-associated protein [Cronbergia sp. UHCC 0137]
MSKKNKPKQPQKNQSQNTANITVNKSNNSNSEPLIIKIKLTSDWHIGSGAGIPGDIDSLVQKDQYGLPYIPAKTLTGILRDACELVAFGLDNRAENGAWQKWVDYLFGEQPALATEALQKEPIPAALSIRAAYFSDSLRAVLKSKPSVKNALTFVKPGISIDSESGCAKEDFLRFEEVVRGGAVLEAKCELNLPTNKEQQNTAHALLVAGTKFVERLGGKRRRGAGKCELEIKGEDIKSYIDWISKHPQPQAPSIDNVSEKEDTKNTGYVNELVNEEWVEVNLGITTKSPLIISKRTVGNVVETLDYIPGTHLLRLIVKKLSGLGVDLGSAIAHGDIIVTNATLEVNGQQGKPVPLALFYEKSTGGLDKGGKIYNRFREGEPEGQLKGYRAGYIDSTDGTILPKHETIKMIVGTHNTVDDKVQSPTKDAGGGIYSYEAIKPGTKLQAKLRLRKSIADVLDKNSKIWRDSLKGNYRIGQSKKDDYGEISLEVLPNQDFKHQKPAIIHNELTVWLLSDVLLRDERLRPTTDIKYLQEELEKHLNVKLDIKSSEDKKLSFIGRTHRIDSWQVRWGLPRPSLVGLAAGTCIVFEVKELKEVKEGTLEYKSLIESLTESLTEIQSRGIGERRAEGYGQISFNDPILTQPTLTLEKPKDKQPENPTKNSNDYLEDDQDIIDYARIIEKAAWREIIHRASLFLASELSPSEHTFRTQILDIRIENGESKPPMSQLGSLRSVLSRIESPEDEGLQRWIQHLQDTKNRRDKWPNGSLDKLRQLITSPTEIWEHLSSALTKLGHQDGFAEFTLTRTGEEKLKNELWPEAVQILIDACIRAHKRELEKQQENTQKQGEKVHGA